MFHTLFWLFCLDDFVDVFGSENAFIRLMTVDEGACLNMLCALEGAIQGVRWHSLNASKKLELKQFYDQVKRY